MIINMILMFLLIGWTINSTAYQIRDGLTPMFYANVILANGVGLTLVYRLS